MSKTIYLPRRLHLDMAASLWAVRHYVPSFRNAFIRLVPPNWQDDHEKLEFISDMNLNVDSLESVDAIALCISANGFGIQTPDTKSTTFEYLMSNLAPEEDIEALYYLSEYIKSSRTKMNPYAQIQGKVTDKELQYLDETGLYTIFLSMVRNSDAKHVLRWFSDYMEATLKHLSLQIQQPRIADRAEKIGKVAILREEKYWPLAILEKEYGCKAIIYVEKNNMGVMRLGRSSRMNLYNNAVFAVIKDAGEEGEWFHHTKGHLLARGTKHYPADSPSNVDVEDLAYALSEYITEYEEESGSSEDENLEDDEWEDDDDSEEYEDAAN